MILSVYTGSSKNAGDVFIKLQVTLVLAKLLESNLQIISG